MSEEEEMSATATGGADSSSTPSLTPPTIHSDPLSPQESVVKQLQQNVLGADFLISVFWSAMSSFRHDSILRPFPPMFVENTGGGDSEGREVEGHKDIEGLRQVFDSLPLLDKIASGKATLSTQQVTLLHWILNPKKLTVCSCKPSSFETIIRQADAHAAQSMSKLSKMPKYIFELNYSDDAESKFSAITGEHGILYAFHGSSVENFHSIVHNGLLNMFNKVSAFGEGTYLSTELGVCLNWSPSGSLWPGSVLPHAASCVAMCQVVKHPSVMSRYQVGGEPNLQQKVPEKYFIVTNDEFIRVKYILVFEMQKPIVRSRSWLYQHKFVVVLLLYIFFLIVMGATQSKFLRRFFVKYYNYLSQ